MNDALGNIATLMGVISILVSTFVAWRSLRKTDAEGHKAEADTYGTWVGINDQLRDEVSSMHGRISKLQAKLEELERENRQLWQRIRAAEQQNNILSARVQEAERENRDLKTRVQSLEHENRVLREQLMKYEGSGVFKIPKPGDKES